MTTDHNALGQPIGWPVKVATPRSVLPAETLTGRYACVTPIQPVHAEDLYAAFRADRDNRIWTYLPNGPYDNLDDFRAWVDEAATWNDPLMHSILVDGKPLGHASFLRIDPKNASIEVGFINFSPRLQRTPAATEAMYLMMAHAFDRLGYRRYEWKCDALNAPSRKAAQRLGFTYEGTFRQATHYKGRNRDTAWFSILDSEWPARKAAFQAWLDPANFDASGQQRCKLQHVVSPG